MSGRQRALLGAGITLMLAGGLVLAWAVAVGQAELSLFLIVPVVHGTGAVTALSILLIFVGFAVTFMSLSSGTSVRLMVHQRRVVERSGEASYCWGRYR